MEKITHRSAKASHYDKEAESYDAFNEKNSEPVNRNLEKIFQKYKIKTALDFSCGTGSQVFWLSKKGYEIVGLDINEKMLEIAKKKAKKVGLGLKFKKGDMRSTKEGEFDAVLTIFNAIGHLTKSDFKKAIRNIHENLKGQGLYIFDIFNLSYLEAADNITQLTIDWQKKYDDVTTREIQYSTISSDGVLASYDIYHQQKGDEQPKISRAFQTLQVYRAEELRKMLEERGFEILHQTEPDGHKFSEAKSERILTVARRQSKLND